MIKSIIYCSILDWHIAALNLESTSKLVVGDVRLITRVYSHHYNRDLNLTTTSICIDTVVDDSSFENDDDSTPAWKIILMSHDMLEILQEPTVSE